MRLTAAAETFSSCPAAAKLPLRALPGASAKVDGAGGLKDLGDGAAATEIQLGLEDRGLGPAGAADATEDAVGVAAGLAHLFEALDLLDAAHDLA